MPGPTPTRAKLLFNTPADLAQFDASQLLTGDRATVLSIDTSNIVIDQRVGFSLVREDAVSIIDNINTIAVGPNSQGEGRWRRSSGHMNTFKRVTTTDATPIDLSMGIMSPAQTLVAVVDITAHDDAGQQSAFIVNGVSISRFGNGPIVVLGSPVPVSIPLSFIPGTPPWNTIMADFTQGPNFDLFITVTGLAGVTIDWVANLEYRTIEVGS